VDESTLAAICATLFAAATACTRFTEAAREESAAHSAETAPDAAASPGRGGELEPIVVTSVAEDSPLTVVVDPKAPSQPIPASDGADS
jgi:hypothetical protein